MTNATDRRQIIELVNEARKAGARLQRVCQELGIGLNTYRRWSTGTEDQRPQAVHPLPAQIVTRLLDEEQCYLASESSFYRVLRQADEQHRRGRAAAPRHKGPPRRHCADEPNVCSSWDICQAGQFRHYAFA